MFKNIATKKTYKTKEGVEKTTWLNVGTLKEFNGKQYIELNMFPNVDFYVFEKDNKSEQTKKIETDYQAMINEVVPDDSVFNTTVTEDGEIPF